MNIQNVVVKLFLIAQYDLLFLKITVRYKMISTYYYTFYRVLTQSKQEILQRYSLDSIFARFYGARVPALAAVSCPPQCERPELTCRQSPPA